MVSGSATPPRIWHPLGGRPGRRAEVIHPPSRRNSAPPCPSQPRLGPVAGTCPQGQVSGTCWASLDCKAGTAPCLGLGRLPGPSPGSLGGRGFAGSRGHGSESLRRESDAGSLASGGWAPGSGRRHVAVGLEGEKPGFC